jgi:hypothetical protein
MPPNDQIFIGAATMLLCLFGLANCGWILDNTNKGARLIAWFGSARAVWVLRGLFFLGAVFGGLLAINILRPVRW